MGSNDDALNTRVVGQCDREGDRGARRTALLFEDVRDGVRGKGAATVGFRQRGLKRGGTVLIEHSQQATRRAAKMAAVAGHLAKEVRSRGASSEEAVSASGVPRLVLFGGESLEMSLVLDLLPLVPAAGMTSDLRLPIEQADGRV